MKTIGVIATVLLSISLGTFLMAGDNDDDYDKLYKALEPFLTPQIKEMPDQKMLEYRVEGDPNIVGGKAFGMLYQAYYSLKEVDKAKNITPRARWSATFTETPKDKWIGIYGLPVPNSVSSLPQGADPNVKISNWKYGTVAEILHVGSYLEERPTIEKLHNFIKASGYKISGYHEEEYVKGPTTFSKGDPKKYLTIIRYPVEKAEK
ncbi:MAG TPA: GyrI-like domain-containing protein [Thermoguttaceae bacterium]